MPAADLAFDDIVHIYKFTCIYLHLLTAALTLSRWVLQLVQK